MTLQRVLITGGAGFLGSHLSERFVEGGLEVLCMDNLLTGNSDNIAHLFGNPRFKFVEYDVCDESCLVEMEQGGSPIEGEVALQPEGSVYTLTVRAVGSPTQIRKVLAALKPPATAYQAALATEKQRETQLLRRVDLVHTTYQRLAQKREELRILLRAGTGMVRIAVPSIVRDAPVAPRKALNKTLAAVLGLMGGTVLAFIVESFSAPTLSATSRPVGTLPSDVPRRKEFGV